MSFALTACRLFVGVVFFISLTSKIRSHTRYAEFKVAARELSPWLPAELVGPVVVIAEAVVVGGIAVPATVTLGFAVALILLGAFIFGMVSAIRDRRQVACQCFGASITPVGRVHIVRNLVLVLGAATGLAAAVVPQPTSSTELMGTVVAGVVGVVAAGLILATDEIADLFGPIA